ncbi:MAG: tetratricopeptide repeat protein [Asgard group archaeon]|nr:tetratricopeptide repeat protein [Asgard group archaeon]
MTLGRLEKWRPEEESEIAYYKRLLRKSSKQYSLLDLLADAFFKQADYEEAIHCWQKLLRKGTVKDKFRVFMKIAQSYEHLAEIEHAYYYYGEAVKENSRNVNAIGKWGQMAYILENYDDALQAFKTITKRESYNEIGWHNLGLTYYNLGFQEEAIKCLETSLTFDEKNADTWYTLATIYAENYLLDDALIALEQAITLDPELSVTARDETSFQTLVDLSLFRYMVS